MMHALGGLLFYLIVYGVYKLFFEKKDKDKDEQN